MEILPFSATPVCVKCGNDVGFQTSGVTGLHVAGQPMPSPFDFKPCMDEVTDHLHRRCVVCGSEHRTKTADA